MIAAMSRHEPSAAAASVIERIREAIALREPVRIVGNGNWLDAGRPVIGVPLETASLSGITEYVPGDLTLTALAGTTLREIATATRANNQWLPLDPFGSPDGTLGATVATASAGPLAHSQGAPRDLVLGLECVTGAGAVIRGGGRVAKNVAGFDLTRLLVGSWGTLGVLTEISVRLRSLPAVDETVAMAMPAMAGDFAARLALVRRSPLEALAMELLNPPLAAAVGLERTTTLLVRLGGNEDSVRAQRATLAGIGEMHAVSPACWEALREIEPQRAWVWRMSDRPSDMAGTWARAESIVRGIPNAWVHASLGRGVVRCLCVPPAAEDRAATAPASLPLAQAIGRSDFGGTIIFERLPASMWPVLARPPAADVISRRVRASFDPHVLLNRGILGELTS